MRTIQTLLNKIGAAILGTILSLLLLIVITLLAITILLKKGLKQ